MTYENLLMAVEKRGIEVFENDRIGKLHGLYVDNTITINSNLDTNTEKFCILAEELGHYYTTHGDIRDQTKIENRKQERKARGWAYERLVSITRLISASKQGIRNRYELAEFLGVSERFIDEAIQYYKDKHGICCETDDYIIYFEPLGVLKKFK